MQYIDASLATVVFAVHPAIVLLILMARGEPLTQRKMIRLGFALVGISLLVGVSGAINWIGVVLALNTALFYAIFLVLLQELMRDYPPQQITLYVISAMAVIVSVASLLVNGVTVSFSTNGWIVILLTAIVSTVIARLLLFTGVKRIGSGQTALLAPIGTLMIVLWAAIFLGERMNAGQYVGAAFILMSGALAAPKLNRQKRIRHQHTTAHAGTD